MMKEKPFFKRVLLKISGDAFCKASGLGIDTDEVENIANQIIRASKMGVQLAVVVGGGNIIRGAQLSKTGVNRVTADHMGMIATVINALALQDALERKGIQTRVMTAIQMADVAEPMIRRRALRHLDKGRIVIMAAGTGNPYFTTDTTAALRATEIGADVLLKATKVDGVYNADPEIDTSAKKFDSLSYIDVLNSRLKVMDATAISLCMDNSLPIVVFNLKKPGNIEKAVAGEKIGTYIGVHKDARR